MGLEVLEGLRGSKRCFENTVARLVAFDMKRWTGDVQQMVFHSSFGAPEAYE
jgi:hypothetical protein